MKIEVEIKFSECDGDWEVNVIDTDKSEKSEDLERIFVEKEEAITYVDSLFNDKRYIVTLKQ